MKIRFKKLLFSTVFSVFFSIIKPYIVDLSLYQNTKTGSFVLLCSDFHLFGTIKENQDQLSYLLDNLLDPIDNHFKYKNEPKPQLLLEAPIFFEIDFENPNKILENTAKKLQNEFQLSKSPQLKEYFQLIKEKDSTSYIFYRLPFFLAKDPNYLSNFHIKSIDPRLPLHTISMAFKGSSPLQKIAKLSILKELLLAYPKERYLSPIFKVLKGGLKLQWKSISNMLKSDGLKISQIIESTINELNNTLKPEIKNWIYNTIVKYPLGGCLLDLEVLNTIEKSNAPLTIVMCGNWHINTIKEYLLKMNFEEKYKPNLIKKYEFKNNTIPLPEHAEEIINQEIDAIKERLLSNFT